MITMKDKLDPLAIVGMSWRFPGDAHSASGFWDILSNGRSTKTRVPADRFEPDAHYHPSADRQGAITTKAGHFLKEDIAAFDAPFFSMTAAEAEGMDPQHRFLLEVTYEAFENAGISISSIAGSQTAVMVGCFTKDYEITSGRESENMSPYASTGCGAAMLANRLSWFYDLKGPSLMVDTACSSSLVGLHLACQELRTGRSKMAVVAGTNLMIQPEVWRGLSALRFISPDGECHSFDSRANGYSRGEGMGVVIVKPLADALRDNDVIRAVIRGTGMNQDGKTPGITVPSSKAQVNLIRSTYEAAGLDFSRTTYFEAHGTGTPVGDPLELSAIGQTIGSSKSKNEYPLLVGSVKSNIGHLEGASGIAGLIKTVLALEQGMIPAVHGFETPNPRFQLEEWNIRIPSYLTPWPTSGLRRASVNSFGYGGTNSHAILDDALHYLKESNLVGQHNTRIGSATPLSESTDSGISVNEVNSHVAKVVASKQKLFVFSAHEQDGVARIAQAYVDFIKGVSTPGDNEPEIEKATDMAAALAYTLSERRTIFEYRSFAVAPSMDGLQVSLERLLPKLPRAIKSPSCAWVFTGQGAQWFAMGRELQEYEIFESSIKAADDYISSFGGNWGVIEELNRPEEESRINEPQISQPLCTIVQVALVELLTHWGLRPKAVVGHSSGEIAAAYASGLLTRENAWKVAYLRGVYSAEIPSLLPDRPGSMMAASISQTVAQEYIDKVKDGEAVVACINSPLSVTISGDTLAVSQIENMFQADNIWCRKLKVQTAYHSPHMEVIAGQYLESIQEVGPSKPSDILFFSSVTGSEMSAIEMGPDYWVKNLLSPVRFSEAVTALLNRRSARSRRRGAASVNALVEIGPHSALQGPLRDIAAHISESYVHSISYMSLLRRGADAIETVLNAGGRLWSLGFNLDLARVNAWSKFPTRSRILVNLPRYPFNHKRRYWHEARNSHRRRARTHPRTDLLGLPKDDHNPVAPRWTNLIRPVETPWIMDHRIQGMIIFPGAAMLTMVLEACKQMATQLEAIQGYQFQDVNFYRPIVFASPAAVAETVLQFRPHNLGTRASGTAHWAHFNILTIGVDNSAIEHCSGLVKTIYITNPNEIDNGIEATQEWDTYRQEYLSILERPTKEQYVDHLYNKLNNLGLQFGPLFRNITQIHTGDGFGYAELQIPDTAARMPENFEYSVPIHPAVLDGVFQMMICCGTVKDDSPAVAPSFIESLYISASLPPTGSRMTGFSTLNPKVRLQQSGNVIVSNNSWTEPKILLKGFVCTELTSTHSRPPRKICTHLEWKMDVVSSHITTKKLLNTQHLSLDPALARSSSLWDQAASRFIQKSLALLSDEATKQMSPVIQRYVTWMRRTENMTQSISSGSSDVPESSPMMEAIETVGGGLDRILNPGPASEVVLTEKFISDFIENALCRSFVNSVVAELMDHIGYVSPNIQILEIGNGSTSCANSVLERLSGRTTGSARLTKYTLTAREQKPLNVAQDLLTQWTLLDVRALDIEQNMEAQGFEAGIFDYIILNELLPTQTDIDLALGNLKLLLNPNGKLLIGAITKAQLRTSFVLGSDPRWWQGHQGNAPISSIPLNESSWDELLRKNGFNGVEHVVHDSEDANLHQLSVMISSVEQNPSFDFSEVVIINRPNLVADDASSTLAANFARHLHEFGLCVRHAALEAIGDVSGKFLVSFLEIECPVLEDMSEEVFNAIKGLAMNSAGILWITRGGQVSGASKPSSGIATGLFRAIRSEDSEKRLGNLDLSQDCDLHSEHAARLVYEVFCNVFKASEKERRDSEFAEDNGYLYVPRVLEEANMNLAIAELEGQAEPVKESLCQEGRPLKMILGEPGLLNTFQFIDDEQFQEALKPDYVEMKVLCTGLNFVDVMAALGQVPTPTLGCEVGGIITKVGSDITKFKPGDKVAGMLQGSFNTHVRIRSTIIQHVPPQMTVEGATTVIIAFLTAWIGLVNRARLRRRETALIHSGAGGVGQAAIQICQHLGVEIFTTVSSVSKKELLMERYGILEDHIFYSRDLSFAQGVMRMTSGHGVDVVLNSASGELLRQSWHCLADFGRFIEIGKRDILENTGLDMRPFLRGVSYIGVNLEQFHQSGPVHMESSEALDEIFHLLRTNRFKELYPITIYSYSEVEQAFRALQSGKMSGKIVVRANPDDIVPVVPRVKPPFTVDPNATYLLAGGLGGIGRSISDMLQSHGAKHLVFISRSGDSKEEAKAFLKQLRRHGCTAKAYVCDISDRKKVIDTIEQCMSEMPPIKGLVQCSMALKDGIYENMSYQDWITCTRPKIQGSWNLHEVLPRDLDFFIMLSSISGVIGNPGQANYAAGNVFQDALAKFRRRQGLKGTSLDLGAVRDIGYIAESHNDVNLGHMQALQISEIEIHRLVKFAITGQTPGNDGVPAQVVTGLVPGDEMEEVAKRTRWARDAKFSTLWKPGGSDADIVLQAGLEALARAESLAAAATIAEDMIVSRMAKVLMIPVEDISNAQPLHSYGVNSLIAVEIRAWMAKEFQTEISVFDILSPIPLSTLAAKIVKGSSLLSENLKREARQTDLQAES